MPLPSAELDARRATIRAAPSGSVAVVDETALLDASAVAAHAGEALRSGRTSWRALPADIALVAGAGDDEAAVRRLVASWAGQDEDTVARRARVLHRDELGAALRPEMWSLVAEHRRAGHRVVVTGHAPRPVLAPLAEDLGADELVTTEVDVRDGTLSGEVAGPVLVDGDGSAKAAALIAALDGQKPTFVYAGPCSAALLDAGERPLVVTPRATTCGDRPVLTVAERGGTLATPGDVLRTAGFYGALLGGASAGAAVGLARRSRRHMVDLASSVDRRPRARAGRHRRRRPGRGAPVVGAAVRLRLQPPVEGRRRPAHEAAAWGLHRRGQGGGGLDPAVGPDVQPGRRRLRRARQRPAVEGGPRARGAQDARRGLVAGDRARGHPLADPAARAVQEGRLPHRDAGRACRWCRSSSTTPAR